MTLTPAFPAPRPGDRDVDAAVAVLAERLPEPLLPLARLAFNLRWSWMPGGDEVFREIDPQIWLRSEGNPRHTLVVTPPRRLRELAGDVAYVERVQALAAAVDVELRRSWDDAAVAVDRPVAYFCAEFALHRSLPIYGGGLGVLAGDVLKAASDAGVPMVGVGLLYRQGYLHQRLDTTGWQIEQWIDADFDHLPAVRVTDADERPLQVELPIGARLVRAQVWRVDVGRVPLYLLDTDLPENDPIDRWITSRLYIGDRQMRLAQYAVLGIGGVRALRALGIEASLIHLNEGHAALGNFERLRVLVGEGKSLEAALASVRDETVFTTHTPVAAGNEGYSQQEVEAVFGAFLGHSEIDAATFYGNGRVDPGNAHEMVGMTPLALRTSRAANAVSRRHGEVSRGMWRGLWPDRDEAEVPIGHVTNGVHLPTWMAGPMRALLDRHLGADWVRRVAEPGLCERIGDIPDSEIWEARCEQRRALVEFVREQSVRDRLARGESHDYVDQAAQMFAPEVLTIGFARRMATYKRFYLLRRFPERSLSLLGGPTPLQLVVAGKAHPQDSEAKQALRNFFEIKHAPGVGGRVAFLEDYDLRIAPRIVAGVDVWLNLPRPPLEASGTSGMKVALNGGLNLSVLDGWWPEGYDGENGWAIATPPGEPHQQDDHDAMAMLDLLELQVVPLFHKRGADGVPHAWVQRVKASMISLIPGFNAERMLHDYVARLYTKS
jgi:starch phosphorylase